MRIIAGQHKGLTLSSVGRGDTKAHLRPTTDRIRESLFNILTGGRFGDPITGARVLDIFAGTGALGLEALSRGAASVSFVETGQKARKLIGQNITLTDSHDRTRMITQDATRLRPNPDAPFDLIFMDPPYGKHLGELALGALTTGGWVAPDALMIWEENAAQIAPAGWDLIDQRRYGDTHITFLRYGAGTHTLT